MSEPTQQKVRALDVVPYRWAVWCSIEGGEPFANTITHVSWSEDGKKIWWMLTALASHPSSPEGEKP